MKTAYATDPITETCRHYSGIYVGATPTISGEASLTFGHANANLNHYVIHFFRN
jgi:hypothetical protein